MAEPTTVHTGDVRSMGNALTSMGNGIEDASTSLDKVGEDIKANTDGESGVGAVIARFGSDGIVILSKALKELGRVSAGAGKRLTNYGNDIDDVEHDLTDGIKGLTADDKSALAGEFKSKIAIIPGNKAAEDALKDLSPGDRASLDRLIAATSRARNRSVDEFRAGMTDAQSLAAEEEPWKGYYYTGTDIEKAVAGDPVIRADSNITWMGASQPGQKVPDFKVGGISVDVTGRSAGTITSHMDRPYVKNGGLILSYPSLSKSFLQQIFG